MTGRTPFGWKALAAALVLGGMLGFLLFVRPVPVRSSLPYNEGSAASSLRTYCGAQNMFRRSDYDGDGVFEYAFPYTLLNTQLDENGERIRLIDDAFANASRDNPPSGTTTPKSGYIFVDIAADAAGEAYDASKDKFHGYLLTLADGLVLIPLMVWSPGFAMRFVLALVWAAGAGATLQAARARAQGSARVGERDRLADRRPRRSS